MIYLGGKLPSVLQPGKARHLSGQCPDVDHHRGAGVCSVAPSPLVDATTALRARPRWRRADPPETQSRRSPPQSSPARLPGQFCQVSAVPDAWLGISAAAERGRGMGPKRDAAAICCGDP